MKRGTVQIAYYLKGEWVRLRVTPTSFTVANTQGQYTWGLDQAAVLLLHHSDEATVELNPGRLFARKR